MTQEGFKRKLTAILSADAVGYSRLMGDDEAATVSTITSYRNVISTLIKQQNGTVIDTPGDNLLAEFVSVVDAVQCAVAVQKELKARNDELPENRKMQFRIGINLGDVIQEGNRIYGDGVNIAARLEGLSEPGGICISKTAFDHIESKLPFGYEFLGDQSVKNISKPVGVYRVLMEPRVTVAGKPEEIKRSPVRKMPIIVGVALVFVVLIAVGFWQFYARHPSIEPASVEKMAFLLPDRPSVAVLPFKNISGDSEQEFLADGITESIIGAISRVSGLFVIASNSVFTYKGKAVKIQTVSEELGIRNVLEGTVQKVGNRLRVNSQLVDAITGQHLWSDKYDRDVKDIFSVQDSISKEILTALQVKLIEGEQARVWAMGTNNLDAYIKFMKSYELFRSFTKNNMILTRKGMQEALDLDPNYDAPYSIIGSAYLVDFWMNWGESNRVSVEKAQAALKKAKELAPLSDLPYASLGHLYLVQGRHDDAVAAGEKSIALNPNGDLNMVLLGITFNYIRRYEEAITLFKEAQRRNPDCPAWYIHNLANSYRWLGRWDEAIAEYKKALERNPDHLPGIEAMALMYAMANRLDEGRAVATEIIERFPQFKDPKFLRDHFDSELQKPWKYKSDAETLRDASYKLFPIEPASLDRMAYPLPEKPSIAVLPFDNLSGDPDKDYIADGISENLISTLSKLPELFVIARNSTFVFKGKATKVQKVAEELGVRYVLEGSVQKSSDKLRVTAQLIDAMTGYHIWSDKYDKDFKNFFQILDEITQKIVVALQIKLTHGDQARILFNTNNHQAWDYTIKGYSLFSQFTKADNIKARELFKKATKLDPEFASAWAGLAWTHYQDAWMGFSENSVESAKKALQIAEHASTMDEFEPALLSLRGSIYRVQRQFDKAITAGLKSIELGPNFADSYLLLSLTMLYAGRFEETITYAEKAIRLSPYYPGWYLVPLGQAYRHLGRYEEAIKVFNERLARGKKEKDQNSIVAGNGYLAGTYAMMGEYEKARMYWAEALKLRPSHSLEIVKNLYRLYKDPKHLEALISAMQKAGIK